MNDKGPSLWIVMACLLILGGLAGWFGEQLIGAGGLDESSADPLAEVREQPDIFLITIGNLRADHLPGYGYHRPTAPWLTEVSQGAHTFHNASATSSWDVPSLASAITGLLPVQHGMGAVADRTLSKTRMELRTLPSKATTLAERLKDAGYNTHAIVANPHLAKDTGFERGFDTYHNVGYARAPRVELAVERISADIRRRQRPVFVWVHFSDTHAPYRNYNPFLYTWVEGYDQYIKARKKDPELSKLNRRALPTLLMDELKRRDDLAAGSDGLTYLASLYDSEIRFIDDHIQLLYGDLGIEDEDLVVITADHGEEFRDHGNLGHRMALYEESVRVPLVFSWPAVWHESARTFERVSQIDLVPTLAEIAGAPIRQGELLARSLLPVLDGGDFVQDHPVTAELTHADGSRLLAIYDDTNKLIMDPQRPDDLQLFDLTADPQESKDLTAAMPDYSQELAAALTAHLEAAERFNNGVIEVELPAAFVEQIRSAQLRPTVIKEDNL